MRKLKLQVQTTVDGYMAGPNSEMDWIHFPWSDDLNSYVDALTESVDTIVLGRKLAEGFIPAWASGPPGEDQASIDWMNNTPKVVITNSLLDREAQAGWFALLQPLGVFDDVEAADEAAALLQPGDRA